MAKQTVPTAMVRRKVREVLAIRPGYGKTESQLLEMVNDMVGGGVSLQELRDATDWNNSQNLIRFSDDAESETTLWFITEAGLAKQNIK